MYDTDEEIKKKRRNLIITIGVIAALILLLIIFLLTRNSGKKKNNTATEIACTIGVLGEVIPDESGIYHQPVTIEFKNIVAISKDYQIVKKTIGTVDRSSNKETFMATNSGSYHVYGYVQDSAGHRGKCELKFQVALSVPSCELEVTQGILGDNGWYRSDVEVGFKSMGSNNPSVSIAKYYIEKETVEPTEEVTKADPPTNNVEKITITDNGSNALVGHVIDSAGNEGTCRLDINKDSTVPTCKLKVNSGTPNEGGIYTDVPEIGFEETDDTISLVAGKGIGITKNYESETFKVTQEGRTTVVGYIKDKAGNEGTCSLEILRPGGDVEISKPKCSISLSGSKSSSGVYSGNVKATLSYSTTNGATITKYGIAESETYNQRKEITVTGNKSHKVYGIVEDSNGKVARCTSSFTIKTTELLYNKVAVGDYVAYDAGKWTETRTEKSEDGYYWGMKSGTSKQTGVSCNSGDSSTRSGWMVLAKTNGQVLLIHAGTPECIYHGRVSTNKVISVMTSEAQKYVNTKYANGWTALSCTTPGFNCNKTAYSGNVAVTGTAYWIAQNGANNTLYAVSPAGKRETYALRSVGLRPVIQLKADVMTTGKKNGAWELQ